MFKAEESFEHRWERALSFYRRRGSVLFISYCRFWERHGFVQQSLAQWLARGGVEVTWLDGSGWRPYQPVLSEDLPRLSVRQLPQVPLRRFSFVSLWDRKRKSMFLERHLRQMKGEPLVWIQAGVDEGVAADLPYIDVFSVFDDPYRHSPVGELCHKAKVIVCQNQTARETLASLHGGKTYVQWPPVDMSDRLLPDKSEVGFPPGFPAQVMGYTGSFFSDGFDLGLFEDFIQLFPKWGFVLVGRTDAKGMETIRRWKNRYTTFHYIPWTPRSKVVSVWKKIRLSLLFYRSNRTQDGAFPVKIVEGLRFGVPCIATAVPKTADLEGVFPRSQFRQELVAGVDKALAMNAGDLKGLYHRFASEMDPRYHLIRVCEWLQEQSA